uniref:Uncharacterized protein n=1 Tax=Panagrolaimus davidi TaxID=227884 RepID=A0A914QKS6_9BILA
MRNYRACDHNFEVEPDVEEIDGHPEMEPIDPYFIRNPPDISWPELNHNDSLIIAMVDIGFGTLKFLSIDYPRDTKVIRKYHPVENFRRGMPTPMALLVFRPLPGMTYSAKNFKGHPDEPFDLPKFMIKHGLESG